MSIGAFFGLQIGKSGVQAHQKALNVTGHNITNAQTPGYSRQMISLKANDPLNVYPQAGQVGTGVTLAEIQRIRDKYLDSALRDQYTFQGEVDVLAKQLDELQTILNEPSDSNIRSAIDELFSALEDVNNQPENTPVRVAMVEKAKSLATMINVTNKRLQDNLKSTNTAVADKVFKINSLAKSVADMNLEIAKIQNRQQNANDVMDERDRLLDELSKYVNIEVRDEIQGEMQISVGEHLLVQGNKSFDLTMATDPDLAGLQIIQSGGALKRPSDNEEVLKAFVGADAVEQILTVTVFQMATNHKMQSRALGDIKTGTTPDSSLQSAGITTGSIFINGTQLHFSQGITFNDLRDTITQSGLGVEAFFENGKMQLRSTRSGTANQITLSPGTSNLLEVMGYNDAQEKNSFGDVIFEGKVQDAKYAIGNRTYDSSSNYIANIIPGVDIEMRKVGSANIVVDHLVDGGELKGLLKYQDGFVQEQIRALDQLSYALIREFNKIHVEGFGLDGQSQRLFWDDYSSPFSTTYDERGAASALSVSKELQNNVQVFAAAKGVFERDGEALPVSSGSGDGTNALVMAQLKFARIVENQEYGLRTRLSILNGGNGVDIGRKESTFVVSNGEKSAVVSLEGFDADSTLFDLQNKINDALTKNGIASQVALTTLADGRIRFTSNNESLTFIEGKGTTGKDLRLIPSTGATGNGSRVIESAPLSAQFRGQPKSLADYFSQVVAEIGAKAEQNLKLQKGSTVVTTQIENQRLSIMGVSMDEELTHMIQYQQGYNASARLISTVNEMLDVIINLGR